MKKIKEILEEGRKDGATVWTNPEIEKKLRGLGLDIPKAPQQGDVTIGGNVVGYMDNWNGLTIYFKDTLQMITKALPKLGVWNPGKAK